MKNVVTRKSTRLKEYDYSSNGAYFVTICVKDKRCLLGKFVGARFIASEYGNIVNEEINKIESNHQNILLDKYIIMPNHIHMIIRIDNGFCRGDIYDARGMAGSMNRTPTIGGIVRAFKARVSYKLKISLWQRSFYDHIIRNENDYQKIWKYIDENLIMWELDEYYE